MKPAAAVVGLLLASTSAFASFGAHYAGTGRGGTGFRLYLDGGEFLGRKGSVQSIRVTVHQLRNGRLRATNDACVYHFDDTDRRQDRIECADRAVGPLRGLVYVREAARSMGRTDELEPMVCARRCTPQVPPRLRLEKADEDNH